MSALVLRHVALEGEGPTVAFTLAPGKILAILGPAGAGKSRFLRALAGEERFGRGTFERQSGAWCYPGRTNGRTKPIDLAKDGAAGTATSVTAVLSAVGLWDRRNDPVSKLTPSDSAAADLLPAMLEGVGLRLVDGLFERLDPWTLALAQERMRLLAEKGAAFVVATNRLELAKEADAVIVLRGGRIAFADTPEDLARRGPKAVLVIEADDQPGVRAIAEPFTLSIRDEGGRLVMETEEGQALAARLLLQGYGNVRSVVIREGDFGEALRSL